MRRHAATPPGAAPVFQPPPYSASQVAFLELYNLLVKPEQAEAILDGMEKLLGEGAADGVYAADGTTLLHAAAIYAHQLGRASTRIVRSLARAKPEQAFVASSTLGYLPLHYAACNGAPLEVVQTIFEAHPAACVTKEKKGLTPAALADKMGHGTIARALERLWQQREGAGGLEGAAGASGTPGAEGGQVQAPR